MKFALATKKQMTQFFDEEGNVHPATILEATPMTVTAVKTSDSKDGYSAVQVGYGVRKEKNVNKAQKVQFGASFAVVKEFRGETDLKKGDVVPIDQMIEPGQKVFVTGISKGKGFQGVVKRHNFHGGPRTHGQKHTERAPGSIGATGPQRVFKGTKMGGRMGTDRVTVRNLTVLYVDAATNIILVKGAVPGRRGTLIELKGVEK